MSDVMRICYEMKICTEKCKTFIQLGYACLHSVEDISYIPLKCNVCSKIPRQKAFGINDSKVEANPGLLYISILIFILLLVITLKS